MKFTSPASTLLALGLGVTLALTGCSTSSTGSTDDSNTSASTDKITISSMANVVPTRAIQAGVEEGIFTKAGLDATVTEVPNPPVSLAALQGGTTDFAYVPLSTALTALSQGVDIKLVAPADGLPATGNPEEFTNVDDTAVFINPSSGITSPSDLAGKTVAVPSRNGLMEIIIAGSVKAAGGDPAAIKWIVLDQESQLTSLAKNRIDAAGIATPFSNKAEEQGMKLLVLPKAGFFENGVSGAWIAMSSTVKDKPEMVKDFQQAAIESNNWINTNIKDVTKDMAAAQKLSFDPEKLVFGYMATSLNLSDVERAAEKMADLGYLDKQLDLKSAVVEAK